MNILELISTIIKMKYSLDRLNSRLQTAEQRVSELEIRPKFSNSKKKKKKEWRKTNGVSGTCRAISNMQLESQKENKEKKHWKNIWRYNSQNVTKFGDRDLQIQEAQQTSSRVNTKKTTSVRLLKTKGTGKIFKEVVWWGLPWWRSR